MKPECSYLAWNVLYYSTESKDKVFEALKTHCASKVDVMSYLEVEGWSNKVFVMAKDPKHRAAKK